MTMKKTRVQQPSTMTPVAKGKLAGSKKFIEPVVSARLASTLHKPKLGSAPQTISQNTVAPVARPSKKNMLIGLLQRPEGVTTEQLVKDLAWLPHTVRAALTGLRKSGYAVTRQPGSDGSIYLIKSGTTDGMVKSSS